MTLFGSIKELYHSITTPDHYASFKGDRPAGHDAVPLNANSSSPDLYVHGNRSAQLNSGPSQSSDIPMAPLGPSIVVAWTRIMKWLEEHYPELHDQVLDGATPRDIQEFEHDLDVALPADVRESMEHHDGQERGGRPTGLIFGMELMDLETVMEEWSIWRRAAIRLNERDRVRQAASVPTGPSSSAPSAKPSLLPRQRCIPANAVQCVYSHPAWIPLAKDGVGNNIAVDLAPGPAGRTGQIILFGRDFDTKYVVAPSWSHFLDGFANDVENGRPYVDDDIEDPIFAMREHNRMVSYLDVLRRRVTPARREPQSGSSTPSVISPVASSTQISVMKLEPKSGNAGSTGLGSKFDELQEEPLDEPPALDEASPAPVTSAPEAAAPEAVPATTPEIIISQEEDPATKEPESSIEPESIEPESLEATPEPSEASTAPSAGGTPAATTSGKKRKNKGKKSKS